MCVYVQVCACMPVFLREEEQNKSPKAFDEDSFTRLLRVGKLVEFAIQLIRWRRHLHQCTHMHV